MEQGKIACNFLWRLMERVGAQLVGFLVSVILARLLEPNVYGTIALVSVLLPVLQVFVDSGLGTALIQKKEVDQLDFSSVFYFNLVMCLGIYVILYIIAPQIAFFFRNNELTNIIRVSGITVLISGVKSIQQAYVSCMMQFKKFFFSTLIGTIISACVGIAMAFNGFGVWALVTQNLVNNTVDTVILWITVKWRPSLEFSNIRLKGLLAYGWKILLSTLITTIYGNMRQILIGKYYTESDLAYYNKGNELPNKIAPNVVTAISSVLLPEVAKKQDNILEVKAITRRVNGVMAFFMWPTMIGIAACGDKLILLILTERWEKVIPYLRLFSFEAAIWPISAILNNSIKAIGRSDINLKIQVIIRTIGITVLLFTIKLGPFIIALTAIMVTVVEAIIVAIVNWCMIDYDIGELISDIFPTFMIAIIMGKVVLEIGKTDIYLPILLCLQIVCGILIYMLLAYICKVKALKDVLEIIKGKREL